MMQQIQAPAPFADLSVCLFCGSSDAIDAKYLRSASAFGEILAHDGVRLVYGGGGIGLMGAAARAAHEAGGRVLGVIPEFLCRKEAVYDAVETLVVPNMHERKRIMFEQADAFAVFPGGIGTLEEAIELISWRRLDLHRKPIVFLNLAGFWEPLFRLIDHTVDLKVTPSWLSSTWSVAARTEDVLPIIRTMLEDQHADPPQAVTIRG